MTKFNCLFNLVLLTLIAVITTVSCHKDDPNPPTQDLKSQVFEYSITELRQTKEFTWTNVNGYLTNGEEKINTLYATRYNEVTLKTTAPVNVSSVDPSVIFVEKINDTNFRLCYKTDGSTVIKMWNGTEGVDKIQKEFVITGKEVIDVTGLRFTYGGEPLVVKHVVNSRPKVYCKEDDEYPQFPQRSKETDFTWWQYKKPNIWVDDPDKPGYGTFVIDPTQGALMRFEGFEPENTSFRTVNAFESEWDFCFHTTERHVAQGYFEEGMYANWPNERGVNKDVGEYTGREIWIAEIGAPTYVACVKVDAKNGPKYLLLYYGEENSE